MTRIPNDLSRVFAAMQIPMFFLLLIFHTAIARGIGHPLFWIKETLDTLCYCIVPCFFLISGYLVIAGIEKLTVRSYFSLLRRRFVSLFIPYMLWLCISFIISRLHGLHCSAHPLHNPVGFFFAADPYPYFQPSLLGYEFGIRNTPAGLFPLWYIRDLMLLIVFTPAVYPALKCIKKAMTPLCITTIFLNVGFAGFQATSVWAYVLGCSLAYNRSDMLAFCRRPACVLSALALWLLSDIAYTWLRFVYMPGHDGNTSSPLQITLLNCCLLCGGIAIFGLFATLVSRSDAGHRAASRTLHLLLMLAPAGFFVYVAHEIWYFTQLQHVADLLVTDPQWQPYVSYLAYAPLRMTVLIALFFLLSRLMPRTMNLLTGGRASRVYAPAAAAGEAPSQFASNASAASSEPGQSGIQTQGET